MRGTLTVLAILAVTQVAPAVESAKALVAKLGSPDFRERERAGRKLAALGDRALPAMKAAIKETRDPEAHRRLEVLIATVESDRLTSARRVTLRVKDESAKTCLQSLAKQSSYAFELGGAGHEDDTSKYDFDLVDVPFWEAVDKVADAAGLAINVDNDGGKISVFSNDQFNPFVAYAGPFKLVAQSVSANRNLQLGGLARNRPFGRQPEALNLYLNVVSEPKAPMAGIGAVEVLKAIDDAGASLASPADPNVVRSYYPPQAAYRSFNLSAGVNLTREGRGGTTIKELRARVPVMVLAETRPDAVIDNIGTAKGKKASGRDLDMEVTAATVQDGALAVTLLFTRRHGDGEDYNWMNSISQRLEAYDDKGGKLQLTNQDQQNVGPNVMTIGFQFSPQDSAKPGKPAKLVLLEWVTVTKEIEFAFKDLPLP